MKTENDYKNIARGILKAELKRRNLSYADLVEKLAEIDVEETRENIANKISRGKFTAVFLIQCLDVIGCTEIKIDGA